MSITIAGRYKVNVSDGLILPVIEIVNGGEIINHKWIKSQDEVECPEETDDMIGYLEEGKLIKLEDFLEENLDEDKD